MTLPFLGKWTCAIDSKRRLTLPAPVRSLLREQGIGDLILTLGHRGCLWLIPLHVWEKFTPALLKDAFQGERDALRLRSAFALYGSLCRLDGSGRIRLTEEQMKVAGLGAQAVVFGNFTRIEIWEPARFERENPPVEDTDAHDRLAEKYLGRAVEEA